MSKRSSTGPSNTLFNYFTKTSPNNKKLKSQDSQTSSPNLNSLLNGEIEDKIENKKRERPTDSPEVNKHKSDSEDDVPIAPAKKRKRIRINPVDSDDSDVENKADNKVDSHEVKEKVSIDKKFGDSFKYQPSQSPKSTKQIKPAKSTSSGVTQTPIKDIPSHTLVSDEGSWTHCKLDWLKPEKIRDAMKRRPDHPDYDPTTLFVPPDFYNSQTPAHRQWWEMKSSHYDCVLFFKVGKFYELYHMDAAVGVNELGFSYMKGEFAHSGFPESAYGRMSSTLVAKGYKVARVEQTETPDMMQERCRLKGSSSKWDKVVRREICQVAVKGAQVCGVQDPAPTDHTAAYMYCIAEEEANGCSTYGVCFVDTSIGQFHLGQFPDDKHSSRLLTTVAHHPPQLVVYDRKGTSPRTKQLVSSHCHQARREPLTLWSPEHTLKVLADKYYRTSEDGQWPDGLVQFLHEGDALGLTPASNSHLAIKALGGCVSYLTDCLLDLQVLGMSQFTKYSPPDVLNGTLSQEYKDQSRLQKTLSQDLSGREGGTTMVLDAITLKNLRIVQDEGCLYERMNFCSTAFGKRLFHQWLCAPSCSIQVITARQRAVRRLHEDRQLCVAAKAVLTTLPDLERLLAKMHALGNLKKSQQHPDSRAIFYEEKTYSKRKVLDFIAVVTGFGAALQLVDLFQGSEGLLQIMQFRPQGRFPDYRDSLKFFKESFNHEQAQKEGRILPAPGVDAQYDTILLTVADVQDQLDQYLVEQEKFFKCRVQYVGSDKKRYQLEVSQAAAGRAGAHYQLEGARKGYKRFSTARTKFLLSRMQAAEEQKTTVLKDLSRRIFEKFSCHYREWEDAVHCIATLDVLVAMADWAREQPGDVCLPTVTFEEDQKPYLTIKDGRHPCIPRAEEFIPNDTTLGGGGSLLLLTGANMGGKSTLMRQTALITVLAHLGSYVPAASCSMSLVDRIFTRLGASDDILSGQSTFLVEMSETAAIVKHATLHSLVLIDELGRGTSTYDGTALASAVGAQLARSGPRVLFSTHYHALVTHLREYPSVVLGHMACMVETDESSADSDDQIPEETITFLYKLSPGASPKSYGFNAARLAGIPPQITAKAHRISKNIEKEAICVRAFREIWNMEEPKRVRDMLAALTI